MIFPTYVHMRDSAWAAARRQVVDGRRCADACVVDPGSRSYHKLQIDTIKTDSQLEMFKFFTPKRNSQGTSHHVRTASGVNNVKG